MSCLGLVRSSFARVWERTVWTFKVFSIPKILWYFLHRGITMIKLNKIEAAEVLHCLSTAAFCLKRRKYDLFCFAQGSKMGIWGQECREAVRNWNEAQLTLQSIDQSTCSSHFRASTTITDIEQRVHVQNILILFLCLLCLRNCSGHQPTPVASLTHQWILLHL